MGHLTPSIRPRSGLETFARRNPQLLLELDEVKVKLTLPRA
jgi:hypothetical protein